jgi:tRNA(Arg) A34 adenosine deaminase TadA
MWNDLSYNWQEAFIMTWESFKNNTIPIGSVIVDEKDNIISRGRNQIFDEKNSKSVYKLLLNV